MVKSVLTLTTFIAFFVLVNAGSSAPTGGQDAPGSSPKVEDSRKAPVRNWGDWWPATQFGEDDSVSTDQLASGDCKFESVGYGDVDTPWGFSYVSLWQREDGIALSMSFFSSSKKGDDGGPRLPDSPAEGEVKMSVVCDAKVVRETRNDDLTVSAWTGSMGSLQGSLAGEFDWLPPDFADYWIRVDMKERRHWFLVPYGLGADPAQHGKMKPIERGGPESPAGSAETDSTHLWGSVSYEVGKIDEMGWHLSASISNDFDTAIRISLYHEQRGWELSYPRTSAVYNWPAGYPRFASWTSISRGDAFDMRRTDSFTFWRTPFDTRNWGLLRITIEDHAFDKVVPSSLFHYTHNWIEKK